MPATLEFQSVGPMSLVDGNLYVNVQVTIATPVGAVTTSNLSGGANTITVPAGNPTYVIIQPPTTNTNTLTFKGVSGDTGVAMSKTAPSFQSLDAGVSSFVLSAGGSISNVAFTWI